MEFDKVSIRLVRFVIKPWKIKAAEQLREQLREHLREQRKSENSKNPNYSSIYSPSIEWKYMNELHCEYKYSYAKILHLLLKNHS